jgi:hypothetical protein
MARKGNQSLGVCRNERMSAALLRSEILLGENADARFPLLRQR